MIPTPICLAIVFYLGCFKDRAHVAGARDMDGLGLPHGFQHQEMTIEICTNYCRTRGFKYAGVQWAYSCYCADKFGKYGNAAESACKMACKGNPNQDCGGDERNGIFLVR
ncbi:unnamed protein product [Owenia fusiformis]|uniref:WSC domain-containing protein n=1 Tax=Owenia fusiformis TaxID=6347 RepID=A0A8S4P3Z8_OWEFU|nr:unnamed protein product [Owenia fusiformis]